MNHAAKIYGFFVHLNDQCLQGRLWVIPCPQLLIKAVEVRVLGKTVMIGNKVCETKDLFSPHPQLMTVNLNPSGSLKLNLVITWKWVTLNIKK